MAGDVVFLKVTNGSRGGVLNGMRILSKEAFLQELDAWNERVADSPFTGFPKYLFGRVDGGSTANIKTLSLKEFESLFSEDEIKRFGRALEYGSRWSSSPHWPNFRKAIHLKYGSRVVKEV